MVRTVAICLVVLNHCVEVVFRNPREEIFYFMDYNTLVHLTTKARISILAGFTLGRLGVPLFLFLTGYLVLSKKFDTEDRIKKFYHHNYFPLLITCEIWIFLYNVFNALIGKKPFTIVLLWKNMLFLERIPMINAWYIPMILGVYIFLPYVAKILQSMSGRGLLFLGVLLFFYCFFVPSCNLILEVKKLPRLFPQLDLSYSGGTYGFYLLLGFCYHRYEEKIYSILNKSSAKVGIALLASLLFGGTVALQNWQYTYHTAYNVWYNFLLLPIVGFASFLLLCQLDFYNKIFYKLSSQSFAIYLIHVPIMQILVKYGLYFSYRRIGIFMMWGRTFILSLLSIYLLTRIPWLKKWIFLMKNE